jgi:hypothetical protein
MLDFSTNAFRTSLIETIAWCSHHKNVNAFRSSELEPAFSLGLVLDDQQRLETVMEVVKRRSVLAQCLPKETPQGRLLLCEVRESVADGASDYATQGFFDLYDIPPWDTWILYIDHVLISWVPLHFVTRVQRGIDVNIVQCLRWAKTPSLATAVSE